MQRYLSIVLDKNCSIAHTLLSDSRYELDKFIYTNYKDSEEVRKAFKSQIDQFLNEHKVLIDNIETKLNKMYRGQIVILQANEDGTLKRVKVIYKKDVAKIKKSFLTDQKFMQKFVYYNRRYFPSFIYNITRRFQNEKFYKKIMNNFYNQIKDDADFFEFSRSILKYAEEYYTANNNIVEDDGLTEVEKISFNSLLDTNDDDSYDPDFEYYPDPEDRNYDAITDDSDFVYPHSEDEETYEYDKPKVKRKIKENPSQLSFFD